MSLPYMTLYVGDYLADTRHLSTEESGAYLHLLFSMWLGGGYIPSDEQTLAKLSGVPLRRWRRIRARVEAMLTREGELMTQRRLLSELQKADDKYAKKVAAGRASAEAKALKAKQSDATGVADVLEQTCQHTADNQSQSQNQNHNHEGSAMASPSPSKLKQSNRGSRWPEGQRVPEDWIEQARDRMREKRLPLPDFALEAERFASYWPAQPGQRAAKTNWPQTFYNWCLNAKHNDNRFSRRTDGYDAMLEGARRAAGMARGRGPEVGTEAGDVLVRLSLADQSGERT